MLSADLLAQTTYLKTIKETQELSKNATKQISEGNINKTMDMLLPYSRQEEIFYKIKKSTVQLYFSMLQKENGQPTGFAKINNATVAEYFVKETYILTYKNTATKLIFIYYQTSEGWMLHDFTYDDSFESEFISN